MRTKTRSRTLALVALLSCAAAAQASADVVGDWNQKAVTFGEARQMAPPQAERVMAMVHLAMFDALNSIDRRYQPALVQLDSAVTVSKEAAAAAAAATVLAGLDPAKAATTTDALAAWLAAIPAGEAKSAGIRLGEAVAAKVLQARADDGSAAADAYRPKARPGVYVPTALTVGSTWPGLKPFALTGPAQFRPAPPIALATEEWKTDYNELKDLGGRASTQRSARQTEDARFWLAPGPAIYYPLVLQLAGARKLDLLDTARFTALIAVAKSDAFVAVFDAKYHYDFWRPITAIRNGDLDDNAGTERDAGWQPLEATPMHPEYPCAHCIQSGSVAAVVWAVLGTDDISAAALTSPTAPGVTHRWPNLDAYTDEVANARIWAGFHYHFSTRVGTDMGYRIGRDGLVVRGARKPGGSTPRHPSLVFEDGPRA